jgi:hypothetical protein
VPESTTLGAQFATALASKEFDLLRRLLHPSYRTIGRRACRAP